MLLKIIYIVDANSNDNVLPEFSDNVLLALFTIYFVNLIKGEISQ